MKYLFAVVVLVAACLLGSSQAAAFHRHHARRAVVAPVVVHAPAVRVGVFGRRAVPVHHHRFVAPVRVHHQPLFIQRQGFYPAQSQVIYGSGFAAPVILQQNGCAGFYR